MPAGRALLGWVILLTLDSSTVKSTRFAGILLLFFFFNPFTADPEIFGTHNAVPLAGPEIFGTHAVVISASNNTLNTLEM